MTFTSSVCNRYSEFKFDGKPSEAVRTCLKGHGFRWSPRSGVWYRNAATGYADTVAGVRRILERENGGPVEHIEKQDSGPDGFDMMYEDDCARQCGL